MNILEKQETLLLNRKDLGTLMDLQDYIQGIEQAFRMHGEGKSFGVNMIHGNTPNELEFHIKSGGLQFGENRYYGLKMNASNFTNFKLFGLPNIMGLILLFEGTKGIPIAIVDASEPTKKRTGAAMAVAAKYLARKDSETLTICGCGIQGRIQLQSIMKVLPIKNVYVYDIDRAACEKLVEEMGELLQIEIKIADNLKQAVQGSDILITCTPSKQPYIKKEFIKPGTFIAAMGADSPDKQELDESLLKGNKIVTDITVQCVKAGELHHGIEKGLVNFEDVHGELGEVICGKILGRENSEEIIIFDATGTAIQDVAAAAICYEKARKLKIGQKFNFFEI